MRQVQDCSVRLYNRRRPTRSQGPDYSRCSLNSALTRRRPDACRQVLTPDSSRFWSLADYKIGTAQKSFDKQYLRDWLKANNLDGVTPPPALPYDVVNATYERYAQAYRLLTGRDAI